MAAATTTFKPITGVRLFPGSIARALALYAIMVRRGLFFDLGIALGIGFSMANLFWYGFHVPRTNARDNFYAKLEEKRAADKASQ
ncbi:cytochrome c oxidase subunit 7 [Geosmithia morbida]|uniref:Cytochrome c oxidase subunit 7 n=1 Tax=Geosmithia morbida TaxID=1094350 RepID=A0A9P4YQ10_9HYPO|nr:cytochrome c oxidase subunit 7 [Geosmithia morbida]KAF4121013.1 cytochrome c oxidase subunit 7 [Geosmithia morbida]